MARSSVADTDLVRLPKLKNDQSSAIHVSWQGGRIRSWTDDRLAIE
jgi:hypothetical protein